MEWDGIFKRMGGPHAFVVWIRNGRGVVCMSDQVSGCIRPLIQICCCVHE